MSLRCCTLILAVSCLAIWLAGCNGGSTPAAAPGLRLTFGTETSVAHNDTVPTAPLDNGATITLYNFQTGRRLASGIVTDGFAGVTVTPGLCIAAVATGQRNTRFYRLSLLIPSVPNTVPADPYILGPDTSIAAEALAQKYYKENKVVDQASVDVVTGRAHAYLATHTAADTSISADIFLGDVFGVTGSLNADVLAALGEIQVNSKLALAKNAVQQIREAGLPLQAMVTQEGPDIADIFTDAVGAKYRSLNERLSFLIGPALFGDMNYDASGNVSITDLELGHAYQAQRITDGGGSYLQLTDAAGGIANQITITLQNAGTTYTLVARQQTRATSWVIKQTCSTDSMMEYRVEYPVIPEAGPGANPSFTGVLSFKDSAGFTTPLTFTGAISAGGADVEHYTHVVFKGALTTPEVTSSGTFTADFLAQVPAGVNPEYHSIYDFPTKLAITNGNIAVTNGATTITLTGSVSANMQVVGTGENFDVLPASVSGDLTYTNSHSGLRFKGEISGNWASMLTLERATKIGTFRLYGALSREGHSAYNVDITLNMFDDNTMSSVISLKLGYTTLSGTASVLEGSDTIPSSFILKLTNQDNVVFSFDKDDPGEFSGKITVAGEKMADIYLDDNMLVIRYLDDSEESFGMPVMR